jgi:hypothetical protein
LTPRRESRGLADEDEPPLGVIVYSRKYDKANSIANGVPGVQAAQKSGVSGFARKS